jgi:hypothetical protein
MRLVWAGTAIGIRHGSFDPGTDFSLFRIEEYLDAAVIIEPR